LSLIRDSVVDFSLWQELVFKETTNSKCRIQNQRIFPSIEKKRAPSQREVSLAFLSLSILSPLLLVTNWLNLCLYLVFKMRYLEVFHLHLLISSWLHKKLLIFNRINVKLFTLPAQPNVLTVKHISIHLVFNLETVLGPVFHHLIGTYNQLLAVPPCPKYFSNAFISLWSYSKTLGHDIAIKISICSCVSVLHT
jgi:hypothetical protein